MNAVTGKLTNFAGTARVIASKGIPEPLAGFLLACAITALIFGSILLVFGADTTLGASPLLVFLVPTILIFHAFPVDAGFFHEPSTFYHWHLSGLEGLYAVCILVCLVVVLMYSCGDRQPNI